MGIAVDTFEPEWDDLSATRARIVRLCARLTGDAHAAEDLAQETLLVAFRQERTLRDPAKRAQWLSGIARNLCLHWRRAKGRERTRLAQAPSSEDSASPDDDWLADDVDLETELEKSELLDLLDRAMALLPPETRDVLVERYVRETPHADVAARLGLSEDAVKKRVERGKLALQRIFTTELRDEARAYGLISPRTEDWQQTRIWCPGCGKHHLEGRFRPEEGELYLRCPGCSPRWWNYLGARLGDRLKGTRTYKPAISRALAFIHEVYRVRPVDGVVLCPGCQEWLPIRRATSPGSCPERVYLACPRCDTEDRETWHSLTWSLPEARRFWQENPRMRFLPERGIEVGGRPAVLTGFESLTGSARIEVVSLRDTCTVLSINGVAQSAPRR